MLHTSYVAWSVSVCSEHGWAVIKTAEPIEMPFVGWRMWVQGNNVLDQSINNQSKRIYIAPYVAGESEARVGLG